MRESADTETAETFLKSGVGTEASDLALAFGIADLSHEPQSDFQTRDNSSPSAMRLARTGISGGAPDENTSYRKPIIITTIT